MSFTFLPRQTDNQIKTTFDAMCMSYLAAMNTEVPDFFQSFTQK